MSLPKFLYDSETTTIEVDDGDYDIPKETRHHAPLDAYNLYWEVTLFERFSECENPSFLSDFKEVIER